jgi:hypothetical protein
MHGKRQKCTQNFHREIPRKWNSSGFRDLDYIILLKMGVSEIECEFLSMGGVLNEFFEQCRSVAFYQRREFFHHLEIQSHKEMTCIMWLSKKLQLLSVCNVLWGLKHEMLNLNCHEESFIKNCRTDYISPSSLSSFIIISGFKKTYFGRSDLQLQHKYRNTL